MPPRRESIDASDENYKTAYHTRTLTSSESTPNINLSAEGGTNGTRLDHSHSTDRISRRMIRRQSQSNVTHVNQVNTRGGLKGLSPDRPFFVQDNNPLLHYEGSWTLSGSGFFTQHSTVVSGSSLWLRFNGSSIGLFGTVPQSNDSFPPPTAIFKIDDDAPFQTTLPLATMDIPNQPIFATLHPLPSQEHTLTINVTAASSPFTVARFIIFPNFDPSTDIGQPSASITTTASSSTRSSTRSSTTASGTLQNQGHSTSTRSQTSHIAIAAILGAVLFVFLGAAVAAYIVWRKRRRQVAKAEAHYPAASNARPDTVYTSFTSTESILRNNSGLWSSSLRSPTGRSYFSRSDGRRSNLEFLDPPPPLPPKPPLFDSAKKPG